MTAPDLFDSLESLDARLVASRYPPLSPFWRRTLRRLLRGRQRWLVARIGRRGGKGLTSCKIAVAFALHAPLVELPPGERCFVQFLSVDRDEAGNRLRMIEAMLAALGVAFTRTGDEIDLVDPTRPITFRVTTASVRGVVGRTTILVIADEGARWRDSDTGSNPAREILAGISPSMSTQPSAKGFFMSAPFAENDEHARRFDLGETEQQQVAHAESWVANPTLSEAQTRIDEPDPRLWAREFAAIPVASVSSICGREELRAVTSTNVPRRPRVDGGRHGITMDPAFKHDRFVAMAWHRELRKGPNGEIVDTLVQDGIVHLIPSFLRKVSLSDAVREVIEKLARSLGVTVIDSDAHYESALQPAFAEFGVRLNVLPQTSAAITARVESLQTRIAGGGIVLLDHAEQTKEILQAQLIAHSGGRLTLKAPERRGAHDDLVSAVLLACDVEGVSKLPPCSGEVEIEYAPVYFDHATHSVIGGGARYYRREGAARVPCEPPYGTRAFVRHAMLSVASGVWTDSIRRWAIDLGLDPKPDLDPALLDPENDSGPNGSPVR